MTSPSAVFKRNQVTPQLPSMKIDVSVSLVSTSVTDGPPEFVETFVETFVELFVGGLVSASPQLIAATVMSAKKTQAKGL
jgi:hypothetical protein